MVGIAVLINSVAFCVPYVRDICQRGDTQGTNELIGAMNSISMLNVLDLG